MLDFGLHTWKEKKKNSKVSGTHERLEEIGFGKIIKKTCLIRKTKIDCIFRCEKEHALGDDKPLVLVNSFKQS